MISEFRSLVCRQKTGSYYEASCPGWTSVQGNELFLNGRFYRYRIERAPGPPRVGSLDLIKQPSPIDLRQ